MECCTSYGQRYIYEVCSAARQGNDDSKCTFAGTTRLLGARCRPCPNRAFSLLHFEYCELEKLHQILINAHNDDSGTRHLRNCGACSIVAALRAASQSTQSGNIKADLCSPRSCDHVFPALSLSGSTVAACSTESVTANS